MYDYDKNLDRITNEYLDQYAGDVVTFECEVTLALESDPENPTVRTCIVTGEIIEMDCEFNPSEIKDKETGEIYDNAQLVDPSELYDYAYEANHPNRMGDEIDRLSREYKHGYYVTANQ